MGLAHRIDLPRAQAESTAEEHFVDEANSVQQPSSLQVVGHRTTQSLQFRSMLSNESHRGHRQDVSFARLKLQHAAAVSTADRLCTEKCHGVQGGKWQQLTADLAQLRTQEDPVDRVQVMRARDVGGDPRGVAFMYVTNKSAGGRYGTRHHGVRTRHL